MELGSLCEIASFLLPTHAGRYTLGCVTRREGGFLSCLGDLSRIRVGQHIGLLQIPYTFFMLPKLACAQQLVGLRGRGCAMRIFRPHF
jgi:hypothetical protein